MLPPTKRWARIGPTRRSWLIHTPRAGLCLSAFVIAQNRGSVLLGLPRSHNAWPEKGGFPKMHAKNLEEQGLWLLPATHLLMEESPDHAAKRIAKAWAGLEGQPKLLMVQSHKRPSALRKLRGVRENHWDVCFVYTLKSNIIPRLKPWWKQMKYVPIAKLNELKIGRGHDDILEGAGFFSN